jgi:uncharacterized protein (TIGR03118 family)
MGRHCTTPRVWLARAGVVLVATAVFACGGDNGGGPGYSQTDLVANTEGTAPFTDPNLLNSWGIARSPNGPWWVANNHAGVATVYNSQGQPVPADNPLIVTIPPPASSPPDSTASPTGIVFNSTADFRIGSGATATPATFIFSTEDGTISAWAAAVNPTAAVLTVDNSADEAIYKGLAIASTPGGNFIYASNFHEGTVDVFTGSFAPAQLSGSFHDSNIPSGYAPFGIQNINGDIYVTYAKQDADAEDDMPGVGNGYVDIYTSDGELVRRFASKGQLNSPWGVVQVPSSFGRFGGAIIIGNFGDGHLNGFDPISGTFQGQLNKNGGATIAIPGLWGLGFGNGGTAGSTDTLFFAAGPNDEADGLFGFLEAND